jgi:hypothetical protein
MPTTVGGLFIFAALLVPGFIHYVQRRARIPQRTLSPLVETATLTTISIATNLAAIGVFGVLRAVLPQHTPDVRLLILQGSASAAGQMGYLLLWGTALIAVSSGLAFLLAARPGFMGRFSERFAPAIVDVSAWFHVFEEGPENTRVFVGCDLQDGFYVGGFLDWYSTEVVENGDRDFVLAEPITMRPPGARAAAALDAPRLILSAREVRRLYVSYIAQEGEPVTAE